MPKTRIEWCDYSINPVKGLCPVACDYCYARRLYKRFKWDTEIRFDMSVFNDLPKKKPGSKVFWGSTIELFGDWIDQDGMVFVFNAVKYYSKLTHIFLTKRPENLIKWSPFPDNVWVGLSVDGTENAPLRRIYNGLDKTQAKVKFISFEPLLADLKLDSRDLEWAGINWVIIGQRTPSSSKTSPKMSWIQNILVAASNAGDIPVFMKNNLEPLLVGQWAGWKLRQEFPR